MSNCSDDPPFTKDFYAEISSDVTVIVFLVIACILTVITLAIFAEEVVFIYRHYHDKSTRSIKYTALLALYPVVSVAALVSVIVPTSSLLLDLILSCYLSMCIYLFITVTIDAYGGTDRMIETLAKDKISLSTPPLCCIFFCCLRPITMTKKALHVFKLCAMQVMIIRPFLLLIAAIMWTDGQYEQTLDSGGSYVYIMIISSASTLLSLYGLIVIFKASKTHLSHFSLVFKFASLQLMLILVHLQTFVFNALATKGIPGCRGTMGSSVRSENLNNLLLVLESFLLSLMARKGYRILPQVIDIDSVENGNLPTFASTGKHKSIDVTHVQHNEGKSNEFDNR